MGEGALGSVYLIEYEGKIGALKMFKQKSESGTQWAAALKELYISLYLSGKKYFPKVEKVFYTNDDNGNTPFSIMYEYIEGQTLGDFMKTLSSQKEYDILAKKIEDILDYFCKINIVHNDFHLSNIMVIKKAGGDYELKVIDFGYTNIEKCIPSLELVKFISVLFMYKGIDELTETFVELYRKKYVSNEKCILGDEKFIVQRKFISTKDIYNEMKNKGLSKKFFEMCYDYYFREMSSLIMNKSYGTTADGKYADYNKLFFFNIDIETKYVFYVKKIQKKIDFAPYKNYFSKM